MSYLCKRDIKALALGFERRKGQSLGDGELPEELIKALLTEGPRSQRPNLPRWCLPKWKRRHPGRRQSGR